MSYDALLLIQGTMPFFVPVQAAADSSGMLMDEQEGISLADLEQVQDARPGPAAGRHTKRRR